VHVLRDSLFKVETAIDDGIWKLHRLHISPLSFAIAIPSFEFISLENLAFVAGVRFSSRLLNFILLL
jgi:hypothetical protein